MHSKAKQAEWLCARAGAAGMRLSGRLATHGSLCPLAASALLLCGCAANGSPEWTKPGVVPGQREIDIFICEQWSSAGKPALLNPAHFESCMTGNGWRLVQTAQSGVLPAQ
jgi:hypothetical protein